MKTKTVNLYEFNELSDSAKEKARQWFREASCGDSYWSESTIEEATEQAQYMGFDVEGILFSGFSCQGDGACFTGEWNAKNFQPNKVADGWGESDATAQIKRIGGVFEEFSREYPNLQVKISHRDRYYHERSVDYDFHFCDENGYDMDWPEKFCERSFKETCVDLFKWIYRQLEKEHEYQNDDEQVDESILANEYTFLISGERED